MWEALFLIQAPICHRAFKSYTQILAANEIYFSEGKNGDMWKKLITSSLFFILTYLVHKF